MNKNVRSRLIGLLVIVGGATGTAGASDLPCVTIKYNLPVAGSNTIPPCSPVDRPAGWTTEIEPWHHQDIIGPYYVEARVRLALPQP